MEASSTLKLLVMATIIATALTESESCHHAEGYLSAQRDCTKAQNGGVPGQYILVRAFTEMLTLSCELLVFLGKGAHVAIPTPFVLCT